MSIYGNSCTRFYLKNHLISQLKNISRQVYILKKLHNTLHHWGKTFLLFLSHKNLFAVPLARRGKTEAGASESELSSSLNPTARTAHLNVLSHINKSKH